MKGAVLSWDSEEEFPVLQKMSGQHPLQKTDTYLIGSTAAAPWKLAWDLNF